MRLPVIPNNLSQTSTPVVKKETSVTCYLGSRVDNISYVDNISRSTLPSFSSPTEVESVDCEGSLEVLIDVEDG